MPAKKRQQTLPVNSIKLFLTFFLTLFCLTTNLCFADVASKYPDYSYEYLGRDKFENFNRKVFVFNTKLNKYALKPVHIVWASVMPKYGMDRIQSAQTNIEFPRRVVSTLLQKDFKAARVETARFVTNSTIGLLGLYDPAKKYFKLEPVQENMEQALSKFKVKSGPYLVMPFIASSTPRSLLGKALDTSLDPTIYIGSPIAALVKAGLTVNRTSYMQPLIKMMESTFADPYDIARKMYGVENYIKTAKLNRKDVLDMQESIYDEPFVANSAPKELLADIQAEQQSKPAVSAAVKIDTELENQIKGGIYKDDVANNQLPEHVPSKDDETLLANIILEDFNPKGPVADAMRTVFFELPNIRDSAWSELSVWNRCFANQIKTASVPITLGRENYRFKYILQKDKNAPVAIIYPSIGEGISSHHSVVFAKLFYDKGYSVVIQGSHFHWEFVKSMPNDYRPGIPTQDVENLRIVTSKILDLLKVKYDIEPREKVVLGTSFGALTTLFLADAESKENTLNISKFISICPPIELLYALRQLDSNNDEWNKHAQEHKHIAAVTAAKALQTYQSNVPTQKKADSLAFSEYESKLITSFILRQKLSDLVFTLEGASKNNRNEVYALINNMSFKNYVEKYHLNDKYKEFDDLAYDTSLYTIKDYLTSNNNYKIYHSLDDYFVNQKQLKSLKNFAGDKLVLLNNGSHLGFLYREEFINELKKDADF